MGNDSANEKSGAAGELPPPDTALAQSSFTARALIVIGLVLGVGLLVAVVWLSIQVWLAVFAGVVLAIFLRSLSDWVSARTRLPPIWALTVTVVALLALGTLVGWLLAPNIAVQFGELADRLPEALQQFRQWVEDRGWTRYLPTKLPAAADLAAGAGKTVSRIGGVFSGGIDAIAGFLLIVFLGLYLAAGPETHINGLLHLFPIQKRARLQEILTKLGTTLRYWLLGQILSMIVVGILVGIGLKLLGVPLALALGILAGVMDFIPIIGPWVSAIPAVLLAFLISPLLALYVVLLFVIVNFLESHLLVPLIQRYVVSVPASLTIVALVLLGKLFGFLGLLLATPLTATLLVLVRMLYVEDVLRDTSLKETKRE
jgi:predicted PurR-regulated permease PerM